MESPNPNDIPAEMNESLATTPPHLSPSSTGHRIFLGPYGLRAGWGISIFVVVFAIAGSVLTMLALTTTGQLKTMMATRRAAAVAKQEGRPAPHAPQHDLAPAASLTTEAAQFAGIVLATLLLAVIEHRRMRVYGIGSDRRGDFLLGALWGLLLLSALVGVLAALHLLVFDSLALHGAAILRFGLEWLVMFLAVGLTEEYLMRGYMQYTLTRGLYGLAGKISVRHQRAVAFWMAAVFMSLLFSSGHLANGGENPVGLIMVFCAGMVFSYALWRTGSLWWGIGFHTAWDWAQSFLWGVPDSGNLSADRLFHTHPVGNVLLSGGADGPEGSLLVLPVLLLIVLAIRLARPGVQPPLEPEDARHDALRLNLSQA